MLRAIIEHYGGGPVGLNTLGVAVGEDKGTIEEVYEPYLIKEGFLQRTPKGRIATAKAFSYLGYSAKQILGLYLSKIFLSYKDETIIYSESVSEGHPDKVADQISDAILDELLRQDPLSRVAVETMVTTGLAVVAGEVTTKAYVDIQEIVRDVIHEIGYTKASYRFDSDSCGVLSSIHTQSPDIAKGVDADGAGDQGMMFGYATRQTPELMPMPLQLSHTLLRELAAIRKHSSLMPYLVPDSKSQVTIEYNPNGSPKRIHTVVISTQHDAGVGQEEIAKDLQKHLFSSVLPEHLVDSQTIFHVNPTGSFVIGGPHGDAGLTGRKVIVDTYGGFGAHGGGAFSGKILPKWTLAPLMLLVILLRILLPLN